MLIGVDGNSESWAGRCERCGGPRVFGRVDVSANDERISTPTRMPLPRPLWIVAEKWFAWRTSHEMLGWYQRVRGEDPELTGRALYHQVIVRRLGLEVEAARGILQRAYQSFCEWPLARTRRFRDVVHYVVVDEYLRSHPTNLGTYTDMGKVVAYVIPHNL
jgi:hypothetical protein